MTYAKQPFWLQINQTVSIADYGSSGGNRKHHIGGALITPLERLPLPPYKVYNIGNNNPENLLLDFIEILGEELVRAKVLPSDFGFEAHKKLVPTQAGDVPVTYADTSELEKDFGFKPHASLRGGLRKFAEWYAAYYLSK